MCNNVCNIITGGWRGEYKYNAVHKMVKFRNKIFPDKIIFIVYLTEPLLVFDAKNTKDKNTTILSAWRQLN